MDFKKEVKGLFRNTMYLYLVQGLNYILPMLVLPYLIKTLSIVSFGIYSFVFAFSQIVLLFVDFGFNISATKKIAENHNDNQFVKQIFWNVIFVKSILAIISLLITLLVVLLASKWAIYTEGILLSFVMIVSNVFFPLWWFQGLNKMKTLSIINAVSKVFTYPLIFVFVVAATDHNKAIIIQSMSFLIASILAFVYIRRHYPYYFRQLELRNRIKYFGSEIKDSYQIFLSNSTTTLYTNSLTLILGCFYSSYHVGLFGAMERIVRVVCFGILGPINQAVFPFLVQLKTRDFNKANKIFKMVILIVLGVLISGYGLYFVFENFIHSYFLSNYAQAQELMPYFMLMIFPIALGGVLGQLGLLALGKEVEKRAFSKVYIYIGLFSLPFSIFFIRLFAVEGAMFMMLGVETLIFLAFVLMCRKYKYL
ncbi:MAG: oligosaccharide flippase family protein [Bacteroidota bacterium]|nr:oligosaccharide flippase family protein [Bacteroidota bacterium]